MEPVAHLRAPAKLNLYLRVLGRRPDGYHELETVCERLDLSDELALEAKPRALTLTCEDRSTSPGPRSSPPEAPVGAGAQAPAQLPLGDDNLILQAARLLRDASGTSQGARIHLTKRIPIAAGLGGGSSDAAATLAGLNQLWSLGWERERLVQLAARLGSDVPFFLAEAPFAIGRGRGERCEPVRDARQKLAHVLVVPSERLSTKAIYAALDQAGSSPAQFDLTVRRPSVSMMAHALRNGSLGELAEGLWNDLQPEAIRRCPVISLIQLQLRRLGCLGTLVSGSGSAVFGLCRDTAHANEAAERLAHAELPAQPATAFAGSSCEVEGGSLRSWRIEVVHTA
jgi:4-diphosphocytidyl-2-C-methyl-D-erythritol kinase